MDNISKRKEDFVQFYWVSIKIFAFNEIFIGRNESVIDNETKTKFMTDSTEEEIKVNGTTTEHVEDNLHLGRTVSLLNGQNKEI